MKSERKSGGVSSSLKKQQQHNLASTLPSSTEITAPTRSSLPLAVKNVSNKGQQPPQKHIYSDSALRNNYQVLEQSRTCQAAVSGMASGILGLTGTLGFLLYFICVLLQAFVWHYKAGFRWSAFFTSRSLLLTHSVVGGLFTYVLFWVFVYGLVHVY
uniref:ER membrane protein complex subunit 6 n=1 Tax=Globodera rostochiensis TaxID=31243 RepID=A0A914HEF4_GLORO